MANDAIKLFSGDVRRLLNYLRIIKKFDKLSISETTELEKLNVVIEFYEALMREAFRCVKLHKF